MNLEKLLSIIADKVESGEKESYISVLFQKGQDRILQKVGEEAIEVIIAGKNRNKKEIIYETSDLIFHLLIFLYSNKIDLKEIFTELERRKK